MYEELVEEQRRTFFSDDYPPATGKPELTIDTNTNNFNSNTTVSPTSATQKRHTMTPLYTMEDDWIDMEAFMDAGKKTQVVSYDDDGDVQPAWEQYADLGGLTEVR